MHLTHLSLTNFRNFARLDTDVPRGSVLLVGSNAQGKTSLLEAVYFLATFSSFQSDSDRELINFLQAGEPLAVARIVAEYCRAGKTQRLEVRVIQEIDPISGAPRVHKEVLQDGVQRKLMEALGGFNAVLFLPQMMHILEGSPEGRRRYLNLALSQVMQAYGPTLTAYGRALSQRNALLKQLGERGGDPDQLQYWDREVANLGSQLIHARIQAIRELETQASRAHRALTRGGEVLRLDYRPAFEPLTRPPNQYTLSLNEPVDRSGLSLEEIREGFFRRLQALRAEEIARGVTTIGPHRDDLGFLSNGIDLRVYGSRGQIRTAMLSMKLAEVDWMKARTGFWPVLLLDEVLAELDHTRREDLLARVADVEQALLTTTDLNLFAESFVQDAQVWEIEAGRLRA